MRARARNQPKSSLICAGCRLPSATAATATASFLTSSAPSRRQLAPASCSQPNWPIHFGAAARSWRARARSWSSSFVKSMAPGHINFCQPGGGGGAKLITAGTPSGSPGRRRAAGSTRPSADLSKWPLTAPLSQSRPSRLDSRRAPRGYLAARDPNKAAERRRGENGAGWAADWRAAGPASPRLVYLEAASSWPVVSEWRRPAAAANDNTLA